jgi:hypothetical protein
MAAAWPTVDDVKNVLRIGDDPNDDTFVGQCLAAAVQWVTMRADPGWVTAGNPGYLPDPLFQAAMSEAARLYRRRDSVDGTAGWGDMGVVRIGPKDPDIEAMLAPFVRIVVG